MIQDFQRTLANRLLLWAGLNVVAGLGLLGSPDPFWRGLGVQALAWGAINAAIALIGRRAARQGRQRGGAGSQGEERAARSLRRLLWINTGLDVLYVAGGLALALVRGPGSAFLLGTGWGIVIQGAFLFLFDLVHALGVPQREPPPPRLNPFSEPEHLPFRYTGGRPAALLVHGFGGTPAEMRGLGDALRDAGWTVQGLLLPGFGPDIATLPERRPQDWLASVEEAITALRQAGGAPLLLVGYSLGGTLSILASATAPQRPDGVVLLAPYWGKERFWFRVVRLALKPFLPATIRPFRKADFGDARLREGLGKFLPGLDLCDPLAQQAVRRLAIPLALIEQLADVSRLAYERAALIEAPVLVVQGKQDETVRPEQTRRLRERFSGPVEYLEVEGGHDLVLPSSTAWPAVREAVLAFAVSLLSRSEMLQGAESFVADRPPSVGRSAIGAVIEM